MRLKQNSLPRLALLAAACVLLTFATVAAQAKDLKFEALLVWATNAEKSPDPKHKPVESDVRQKLSELPLKWKNYFAVTNVAFNVSSTGSMQAVLSEKCKIEVRHVKGDNIEVSLIGKGEPVYKRTMPLSKGDLVPLLGGNAPGNTGWIVMLKRLD